MPKTHIWDWSDWPLVTSLCSYFFDW